LNQSDSKLLGSDHNVDLEPLPLDSGLTSTDLMSDPSLNGSITQPAISSQNEQAQSISDESTSHWSGQTTQGNQWDVYLGDAKVVLNNLPANKFHCVVTSPPYYWLRDYGVEGQIGLEWTISEYVQAIAGVMDQVKRVLASSGVLFLNIGDTYYSGKGQSQGTDRKSSKRRFGLRAVDASGLGVPMKSMIGIPWRVGLEMIDRGWILRSTIIWDRLHALPESVRDRPGRTYEYIFMFVKSRKYYFNQHALGGQKEDVWTISARPRLTPGISTAPFPDELAQKCIDVGCPQGGSVLDPFAGSGTTLRIALENGRTATGIDIHPTFCSYMVNQLLWL